MKKNFMLLLATACTSMAAAQWNGFTSFTGYPVKRQVTQLVVKDITGDELQDILTLYTASDTEFGLFKGSGSGQFLPEQQFSKQINYFQADLADLNKDGFLDLVITSYWDNGFTIFLGNGSGNFSQGTFCPTGVHGREIKCTDINNDGNIDIIATTCGSGNPISLHVFIGRGDGTFLPKKTYGSPLDTSKEIIITDKNNDGLPDIVVASFFPWLQIWYQLPDGNFTDKYLPTQTIARAGIADFNKDGKEDLLLYYTSFDNGPGFTDSMIIKPNNGDTNFAPSILVSFPSGKQFKPSEIKITDINKDGYPDLFMNNTDLLGYNIDTLYYATGGPDYHFSDPVAVALPAPIYKFVLADIDSDGYDDLIISCTNLHVYVAVSRVNVEQPLFNDITLFPNPAHRYLYISDSKARPKTITLYNTVGQILQHSASNEQVSTLPTTSLPAGLYYLHIQVAGEAITLPFIKR